MLFEIQVSITRCDINSLSGLSRFFPITGNVLVKMGSIAKSENDVQPSSNNSRISDVLV